jgi:hypothetical protein
MEFQYLLDKIESADFLDSPFRHLEIADFFSEFHLSALLESPQIKLPQVSSDIELVKLLDERGYTAIGFPGATTDVDSYLAWRRGERSANNRELCERFGVAFRLLQPRDSLLQELGLFFQSREFQACLADKFEIDLARITSDSGLQKYLDGYEISPHPDVRRKALTYMLNVNPASDAVLQSFHTHYLTVVEQRQYVLKYWQFNEQTERCWLPWSWCRTEKQQRANNSIVLFSPSFDTIHAVKASYDHLVTQRTQFYGNFWYSDVSAPQAQNWRDFELPTTPERFRTIHLGDGAAFELEGD